MEPVRRHFKPSRRSASWKARAGLQEYFNQRIQKLLRKYGKTMVGWDEVLHRISGGHRGAILARAGIPGRGRRASYRGFFGRYYLDHLRPASYHYGIDPLAGDAQTYAHSRAASRILGGEACMWGRIRQRG